MKRRFTLLLWILIVGTVAPLAETLFVMNADKAREEAARARAARKAEGARKPFPPGCVK